MARNLCLRNSFCKIKISINDQTKLISFSLKTEVICQIKHDLIAASSISFSFPFSCIYVSFTLSVDSVDIHGSENIVGLQLFHSPTQSGRWVHVPCFLHLLNAEP